MGHKNETVPRKMRAPRARGYMQYKECNAENAQLSLRTVRPCAKGDTKSCVHRFRSKVDDPFTFVLQVRQERFKWTQKLEKHLWFNKLLECKDTSKSGLT